MASVLHSAASRISDLAKRGPVICAFLAMAACAGIAAYPPPNHVVLRPVGQAEPWKGVVWGYIQSMWCRHGAYTCDWSGIEGDLADMRSAGITWARVSLNQGTPFSFYDRLVALSSRQGLRLLFTIYKSTPSRDLGSPLEQAAYQIWLRQVVERYDGTVRYWEVGNEENLGSSWNIDNRAADAHYLSGVRSYVAYLRETYGIIKGIDPTLQVLIGGISESAMERYVRALIALDAYRYFDILAFHPYGADPLDVLSRLQALRSVTATQPDGIGARPIWITEIGFYCASGWATTGLACPESRKAMYLRETMAELRANGIESPIMWYDLHEAGDYAGYGLERKSASNGRTIFNPAFLAYAQM